MCIIYRVIAAMTRYMNFTLTLFFNFLIDYLIFDSIEEYSNGQFTYQTNI
jgi:hypothetical protein